MAQLFLVRHAQASFGAADYDNLSELGHHQSLLLGNYFEQRKQAFDLVVTGDLKRHIQTTDGILQGAKHANRSIDKNWNEFDFDNIVRAYLIANPEQAPAANSDRSHWYKVLKSAMQAWSSNRLVGYEGETWQGFVERVKKGTQAIQASDKKQILVVSSGGAMAVFLMLMLNVSIEQAIAFNLQIKNTSVNQFFFNSNGFQLNSFNNVPHLDTSEHYSKITYS